MPSRQTNHYTQSLPPFGSNIIWMNTNMFVADHVRACQNYNMLHVCISLMPCMCVHLFVWHQKKIEVWSCMECPTSDDPMCIPCMCVCLQMYVLYRHEIWCAKGLIMYGRLKNRWWSYVHAFGHKCVCVFWTNILFADITKGSMCKRFAHVWEIRQAMKRIRSWVQSRRHRYMFGFHL